MFLFVCFFSMFVFTSVVWWRFWKHGSYDSTVAFATRMESLSLIAEILSYACRGTHDDKVEICLLYWFDLLMSWKHTGDDNNKPCFFFLFVVCNVCTCVSVFVELCFSTNNIVLFFASFWVYSFSTFSWFCLCVCLFGWWCTMWDLGLSNIFWAQGIKRVRWGGDVGEESCNTFKLRLFILHLLLLPCLHNDVRLLFIFFVWWCELKGLSTYIIPTHKQTVGVRPKVWEGGGYNTMCSFWVLPAPLLLQHLLCWGSWGVLRGSRRVFQWVSKCVCWFAIVSLFLFAWRRQRHDDELMFD